MYDEDGNRVVRVRKSNTGMFTQLISDARAAEWEHDRARGRRPAVLQDAVVEEGHRDGRRADGEHPDRVLHLRSASSRRTASARSSRTPDTRSSTRSPTAWSRGRGAAAPAPPRTRSRPPRRPGSSPATRSCRSTAPRSTGWTQLQELIRENDDGQAVIVVERDGGEGHRHDQHHGDAAAHLGRPTPTEVEVGFLGVVPTSHVRGDHGRAALHASSRWAHMTVDTVEALGHPAGEGVGGLAGDRRRRGAQGRQPRQHRRRRPARRRDRVARRVQRAGEDGLPADADRRLQLLHRACSTSSRSLPLDGGHIAGALWEALRRGFARLRGRPDPGYVDVAKLLPIAYVVASVILVMGVVLIVADLVVPLHLES